MKANYRITFHDGPNGNLSEYIDIYSKDSDEAMKKALSMPQAEDRRYAEVMVEELPDGSEPVVVGVKFKVYDAVFKKEFTDYLFILAYDESQAKKYYMEHFMGKHFMHQPGKIVEDGKCTYGKIVRTYFPGLPGYDADATKTEAQAV